MPIREPEYITLATTTGREQVPAHICGPLAVHRGIGPHRDFYVITHVGTGGGLTPWVYATASHAIRVAEALAELPGWDDVGMGRPNPDLGRRAKELLNFFSQPGLSGAHVPDD